ncbi:hypothetical protein BD408DRAFT_443249 [Parasitella parasitica]|nr:hypothetical protein BD408DRAFT_443249 [Parasitella parasitica]
MEIIRIFKSSPYPYKYNGTNNGTDTHNDSNNEINNERNQEMAQHVAQVTSPSTTSREEIITRELASDLISSAEQREIKTQSMANISHTSASRQSPGSCAISAILNASNPAKVATLNIKSDDTNSSHKKLKGSQEASVTSALSSAIPARIIRQPKSLKARKSLKSNNPAINAANNTIFITARMSLSAPHRQISSQLSATTPTSSLEGRNDATTTASASQGFSREIPPSSIPMSNFVPSPLPTFSFNQTNLAQSTLYGLPNPSNIQSSNVISTLQDVQPIVPRHDFSFANIAAFSFNFGAPLPAVGSMSHNFSQDVQGIINAPIQQPTHAAVDPFHKEIDDLLAEIFAPDYIDPSDKPVDIFNDAFPYNLQQFDITQPNTTQYGHSQPAIIQPINVDIGTESINPVLDNVLAESMANDMTSAMVNVAAHTLIDTRDNAMVSNITLPMENTLDNWINYYMANPSMADPFMAASAMSDPIIQGHMLNPLFDSMINAMANSMTDPIIPTMEYSTMVYTGDSTTENSVNFQCFQKSKQSRKQNQKSRKSLVKKHFKQTFKKTPRKMLKTKRSHYLKGLVKNNLKIKALRLPTLCLSSAYQLGVSNETNHWVSYAGETDTDTKKSLADELFPNASGSGIDGYSLHFSNVITKETSANGVITEETSSNVYDTTTDFFEVKQEESPVDTDSRIIQSPLTYQATVKSTQSTYKDHQNNYAYAEEDSRTVHEEIEHQSAAAETDVMRTLVRQNAFWYIPDNQDSEQVVYDESGHPNYTSPQGAQIYALDYETVASSLAEWAFLAEASSPPQESDAYGCSQKDISSCNRTAAVSSIDENDSHNDSGSDTQDIYSTEPASSLHEDFSLVTALDSANDDGNVDLESDAMDNLVRLANTISVDDETISTPPFFPTPSRRRSSEDINTNFGQQIFEAHLLVDSLISVKRSRESTPDSGDATQKPHTKGFNSSVKRQRKQLSGSFTNAYATNDSDGGNLEISSSAVIPLIDPDVPRGTCAIQHNLVSTRTYDDNDPSSPLIVDQQVATEDISPDLVNTDPLCAQVAALHVDRPFGM